MLTAHLDGKDEKLRFSAAVLIGDLSYAVGYQSVWDEFCEQITPWASQVPLLTQFGNHEADSTDTQWGWVEGKNTRNGNGTVSSSLGGNDPLRMENSPTKNPEMHRDRYLVGDSGGECGVPASLRFPTPGTETGGWCTCRGFPKSGHAVYRPYLTIY